MPYEAPSVSLATLLSPDRARTLPVGSRERALAAQSIQHLWHVLFDSAPGLLAAFPPDGTAVFEGFLRYAEELQLAMSWEMHAQLALWLDSGGLAGFSPDAGLIHELAQATAARWARTDQTDHLGLLIATAVAPREAIVAWKCESLEQPKRLARVNLGGVVGPRRSLAYLPLPRRDALKTIPTHPEWRDF